MCARGANINGIILARDNIPLIVRRHRTALAAISRDSNQNRLLNAKRKGEERRRNGGLMNERENRRWAGGRTTYVLFRYSFNGVTKARTPVQLGEREAELEPPVELFCLRGGVHQFSVHRLSKL